MKKIPDNADIVYEGKFIRVYKRERIREDGMSFTFEVAKFPDTACVIPVVDGKIAVAYQTQFHKGTYYSFFGGMIEEGEDTLEGAKRELMEESGLASDDWDMFACNEIGSMIDKKAYIYIARNCKTVGATNLDIGEEMMKTVLLDFDQFIDLVVYGKLNGETVNVRCRNEKSEIMNLMVNNKLEEFRSNLFK